MKMAHNYKFNGQKLEFRNIFIKNIIYQNFLEIVHFNLYLYWIKIIMSQPQILIKNYWTILIIILYPYNNGKFK